MLVCRYVMYVCMHACMQGPTAAKEPELGRNVFRFVRVELERSHIALDNILFALVVPLPAATRLAESTKVKAPCGPKHT